MGSLAYSVFTEVGCVCHAFFCLLLAARMKSLVNAPCNLAVFQSDAPTPSRGRPVARRLFVLKLMLIDFRPIRFCGRLRFGRGFGALREPQQG